MGQKPGKRPEPEDYLSEITAKKTEVGIYEKIGEASEQYGECIILDTDSMRAIHGMDKSVGAVMASTESAEDFVFCRAEPDKDSLSDAACS